MIKYIQRNISTGLILGILLIGALIQANLIMKSAYLAIALSGAVFFLLLFFKAPLGLLMIMVFIFPFSGTEAFRSAMADIPGFKPLQLLSLALMAVALLNLRTAVQPPKSAVIFFAGIIILFTIAIARSLPYLEDINQVQPERLSVLRYILSSYFKPLIYFIPALIITLYVYSTKDIERISQTINWSITILSIVIIGFYLVNPEMVADPRAARGFYASSYQLDRKLLHTRISFHIDGFISKQNLRW